jgi:hypothetical protein
MLSDQVVRRALDLLMELPEAPALQILDLAMRDVSGHISFENLDLRTRQLWGDHLDPPSPFAELVRRAFAPRLDPYGWMLMADDGPQDSDAEQHALVLDAWQDALERFGSRYQLWGD